MALLSRLLLLSFCVVLLGAAPTAAAPPAVSTVANPARLPGSIPLTIRGCAAPHGSPPSVLEQCASRPRRSALRTATVACPPGGFDCSGLVAYVYGRLGVDLPHNAAAQYSYGRPVSRRQLRPGDLVFFHGLGHVGLYVGRGRIIHAPHSGERVEIQSLTERSGSVEGARRLVRS